MEDGSVVTSEDIVNRLNNIYETHGKLTDEVRDEFFDFTISKMRYMLSLALKLAKFKGYYSDELEIKLLVEIVGLLDELEREIKGDILDSYEF
jgi:hypothetical protein